MMFMNKNECMTCEMEKTRVVIQLCYENKFYLNSLNTNSLSENDKFVIFICLRLISIGIG